METTQSTTDKAKTVNNALRLITKFRALEAAPLEKGYSLIKEVGPKHLVSHLRDKWHHNRGDFGSFYLNLDYKIQYAFLNFWGMATSEDSDYIKRIEANPVATLFEKPTGFLKVARQVLLYFNNTGIGDSNDKVTHYNLPEDRFGNSANWGKYLLEQNMYDQVRIIMEILKEV